MDEYPDAAELAPGRLNNAVEPILDSAAAPEH
jgi:hypothetical protein